MLFVTSFTKPIHALGILVYPLSAITVIFSLIFPDTQNKVISVSIAAHVFLSIGAYALLAIAVCQSVLLNIQEKRLHEHKINTFVKKLPHQPLVDVVERECHLVDFRHHFQIIAFLFSLHFEDVVDDP